MPSAVFNPAQSRQTRGPAPPNRIVRPACLSINSEIQIGQWEQLFDGGKLGPCGPVSPSVPPKPSNLRAVYSSKPVGWWEQAERGERLTNKASSRGDSQHLEEG